MADQNMKSKDSSSGRSPFAMSRFPPMKLERPLAVFGRNFKVELSTELTLGVDTVARAAVGKSFQTLMREQNLALPFRQFRDGLMGRHRLSATTKETIRLKFGSAGGPMVAALDGGQVPSEFKSPSDWALVTATWGDLNGSDKPLDILVQCLIELDGFAEAVRNCLETGSRDSADKMLSDRYGESMSEWRALCPDLSMKAFLIIESSLLALAAMDRTTTALEPPPSIEASVVVGYLSSNAKPIGHWLRDLIAYKKLATNRELAALLYTEKITHWSDRLIKLDTLKGWSAMKPGMLMSLEACQALLKLVKNPADSGRYLSRFTLARFLGFLCDLLRSSVVGREINWHEAQSILCARYLQIGQAALAVRKSESEARCSQSSD